MPRRCPARYPTLMMTTAATTPDMAPTAPTDRSKPPTMIMSSIPQATIPMIEFCCRMLMRFWRVAEVVVDDRQDQAPRRRRWRPCRSATGTRRVSCVAAPPGQRAGCGRDRRLSRHGRIEAGRLARSARAAARAVPRSRSSQRAVATAPSTVALGPSRETASRGVQGSCSARAALQAIEVRLE